MAGFVVPLNNTSVSSVKKPVKLSLPISSSRKSFGKNSVSDVLDVHDLYVKERNESRDYRMIFTVNVVASNVLYNKCTEFVYDENGEQQQELRQANADILQQINEKLSAVNATPINWKQALRDTEYTYGAVGNIKYRYGLDIFNNHMLRSNDFVFVGKARKGDGESEAVFNTISDYMRDEDGEILTVRRGYNSELALGHLYQMDSVLSFTDAVKNKLVEKNGWWGFYNPSNIKIPNFNKNTINTLDGSTEPCSFIQLYPDSTLYSFIPIKNERKKRLEKNWDYTLAYPYKNRFDIFNKINTCPEQINGLKVLSCTQVSGENGIEQLVFRTKLRHGLSAGDTVSIYYTTKDTTNKIPMSLTVKKVGNLDGEDEEHYFMTEAGKMGYFADTYFSGAGKIAYSVTDITSVTGMYVVRVVNGCECRYYAREFRKLYLADINGKTGDYDSEVMKLSYATNIYADDIAQLVFTDKISIDGVKDNLGRNVNELALIMVKSNRGHKEWYEDNDFSSDKIECSHCFGKVTSGLDLPKTDMDDQYNVRMLYNATIPAADKGYYEAKPSPSPIEDDLEITQDSFLVDIVAYNVGENKEAVIENIYHRFNTAQRELPEGNKFNVVLDDEIIRDDFDFEEGGFEVQEKPVNKEGFTDNISLEGYYYNPAYKFSVRQLSDNITEYGGRRKNYKFTDEEFLPFVEDGEEKAVLDVNVEYTDKDVFAVIVNVLTQEKIFGYIRGSKIISNKEALGKKLSDCLFVTTEQAIPSDATYNPVTRKFIARKVLDFSDLANTNELSQTPFANGCHYVEKNIRLYVRRQDPFGDYRLSSNTMGGVISATENKFYTEFGKYGDRYYTDGGVTISKNNWSQCVTGPQMANVLGQMANVSTTITNEIMENV